MAQVTRKRFVCGPLAITVAAHDQILQAKAAETLSLYNVKWEEPHLDVGVDLTPTDSHGVMLAGTYLVCRQMRVDVTPTGLQACCTSGAWGAFDQRRRAWELHIPSPDGRGLVDVEDLLGLVLTTGWRRAGWVPVHAGAVVKDGRCIILCASSGGGKSTLSAALLNRGWSIVGDDKVLLRLGQGKRAEVAALLHNMNLHPRTRHWFPEVEQIERLPSYSVWTPKRRVSADDFWPDQTALRAQPTHLVQIERCPGPAGFRVTPTSRRDVVPILLRQTVIPRERVLAAQILATIAATARQLKGLRLEIGDDAYSRPARLAVLEEALH